MTSFKVQQMKPHSSLTWGTIFVLPLTFSPLILALLPLKKIHGSGCHRDRRLFLPHVTVWLQLKLGKVATHINQEFDTTFSVGDYVMVHRDFICTSVARDQPCIKLRPKWFGPYKISSIPSSTTVKLKLPADCRFHPVFHISALKRYHKNMFQGRSQLPPAPFTDKEGHEHYIVDKVLSSRTRHGKTQCLVKWLGYVDPTWEPSQYRMDESGLPIIPYVTFSCVQINSCVTGGGGCNRFGDMFLTSMTLILTHEVLMSFIHNIFAWVLALLLLLSSCESLVLTVTASCFFHSHSYNSFPKPAKADKTWALERR